MPNVRVFLRNNDTLSFRLEAKGARWRGGFRSIVDVSNALDRLGVPVPREIDYRLKED